MLKTQVSLLCSEAKKLQVKNCNQAVWAKCESLYDATSLNVTDSHQSIVEFTSHILKSYPSVASICVSPRFIEDVGVTLSDSRIGITAVVGSFPMAQTYIEVKILECSMAIENGADELDFVIDVSAVNNGDWEKAKSELEEIIGEIEQMATSKVILECGALKDLDTIYKAGTISLEAGADFIKTSTGKIEKSATPEFFATMCLAIKDYYEKTGDMRGIKVAGGIKTKEDVSLYYTLVEQILGEQWLSPEYFRIGTSSLVK